MSKSLNRNIGQDVVLSCFVVRNFIVLRILDEALLYLSISEWLITLLFSFDQSESVECMLFAT